MSFGKHIGTVLHNLPVDACMRASSDHCCSSLFQQVLYIYIIYADLGLVLVHFFKLGAQFFILVTTNS